MIKIKSLNVSFSKELIQSYKLKFDHPNIEVIFYLTPDKINIIKQNIIFLKRKFKNLDTDYKTNIGFTLSNFTNSDVLFLLENKEKYEFIQEEDNDNEVQQKDNNINNIEESNNMSKSNMIINIKNKEEIKEEKEEEDEIMNPFTSYMKRDEKEEEKNEEKEEEQNIIKKKDYIKIKDMNKLNFPPNININIKNKLTKYLQKNIGQLKETLENNALLSLNNNNSFPIIKNDDNSNETIELKNISYNDELEDLKGDYHNDILLNFLNVLNNYNINNNDEDNEMSINDYTLIVLSFIKNIEKRIIDIKKKNENNDKKYIYYLQRLEKIISTLKLFHILFLNCFISNDNNNNLIKDNNNNELFENYSFPKVKTMRKNRLIEWCMDEERAYVKRYDLLNINKTVKRNILSKQIMSFGQIKMAINSSAKKNLFINAKLSNFTKDNSQSTFSYFIQNQKTIHKNKILDTFISYEPYKNDDKIKNNWISFLLQSLLYIENSNEYIIKSINLIDENIEYMDDYSKPYVSKKNNNENNNNILNLNYLLLKIYEKIIVSDENGEGAIDIQDIEKYINMLSNNNIFNTNNSDNFLQYIILYLFIKIINIIIPGVANTNILIKKHYFLLIQIISEILSNNNNNNNKNRINDLLLIIKLLNFAVIKKKLKRKIIIEIICHQNLESIEQLWEEYNKDNNNELINKEMQEYINGIYYMNKCDWNKAYGCFLKSKNYEYCLNSYMNYCFYLIENKKIKDINFEEIYNNLSDIQTEASHLFTDFYEDFYLVIYFIVYKDTIDYEKVIELLKKYLDEYNDNGKIKNIDLVGL